MNQKAKEEWEKKQAEEAEKLRKHNEVSILVCSPPIRFVSI